MTMLNQFKANLKVIALDRQAALFAKADALDALACRQPFESRKRSRLHSEATALRDEACTYGDRYHQLVAA